MPVTLKKTSTRKKPQLALITDDFSSLARVVSSTTLRLMTDALQELSSAVRTSPGYELFQYLDDEGQSRTIDSEDVNTYLREITGEDFTAKDFRTWAGTVLAARELKNMEPFESKTQANKNVVQAIKAMAKQLGNRPATCRKYYVHPAIIDAYLEGTLGAAPEQPIELNSDNSPHSLREEELAVVAILEQSLNQLEKLS